MLVFILNIIKRRIIIFKLLFLFSNYSLLAQTHPVLFDVNRFDQSSLNDPASPLNNLWTVVKNFSDTILASPLPPSTPGVVNDLDFFRNYGNELLPLAFTAYITQDTLYINRVKKHLLTFAGWERWDISNSSNPDSAIRDLGTAHLLIGNSIAFDWVYNQLLPSEVDSIVNGLSKYAGFMYEAATSSYNPFWMNWWRKSYLQNHTLINYSALGIAALVLEGHNSSSVNWLNLAINRVSRITYLLDGIKDGTWHEGHNYQLYMFSLSLPFLSNLKTVKNIDLIPQEYFDSFVLWRAFNIMPGTIRWFMTYGDFELNWGDNWSVNILRFIASDSQNNHAQYLANRRISIEPRRTTIWSAPYTLLELMYYDKDLLPEHVNNLPLSLKLNDLEGVVWRSGWLDASMIFGLKASAYGGKFSHEKFIQFPRTYPWEEGGTELNFGHKHNDALTFYLFNQGSWLADEVVNRQKATSFHNSLLIDNYGQYRVPDSLSAYYQSFIDTEARIDTLLVSDFLNYVSADATNSYYKRSELSDVSLVTRSVLFIKHEYFIMIDNLKSVSPRKYTWICHFQNDPVIEGEWIKGVGTSNQLLGIKNIAPSSKEISTGNNGKPWVHISNSINSTNERLINFLYPTNTADWGGIPEPELVSDVSGKAHIKLNYGPAKNRMDNIIISYESSETVMTGGGFNTDSYLTFYSSTLTGAPLKLQLINGSFLTDLSSNKEIVKSELPVTDLSASFSNDTCYLSVDLNQTIKLFAPSINKLILNGELYTFNIYGDYIVVNPPEAPLALFDANVSSGETPLTVLFTSLSKPGALEINSWEWDFNGDGITDITGEGPHNYIYPEDGNYSVSLKVSDGIYYDISLRENMIQSYSASSVVVNEGWNMVSVPVEPFDPLVSHVYPASISNAFGYNNGYFISDSLETGKGYWLKFAASDTINVNGIRSSSDSISVQAGWNMIAPFHEPLSVSNINSSPPGIISSGFFGFINGYSNDTLLIPGKAYWVKTSLAGKLYWDSGDIFNESRTTNLQRASDAAVLYITDATGKEFKLYFVNGSPYRLFNAELPPIPPAGISDARFKSNRNTELINEEPKIVIWQNLSYPLKLRSEKIHLKIRDLINSETLVFNLFAGEEKQITEIRFTGISVEVIEVPSSFILYQNYPNPFNPVTKITYGLHEKIEVSLTIFNILGERIYYEFFGLKDPGYHSIDFNASGLSSGVYIYHLRAGRFHSTKKMMVIR